MGWGGGTAAPFLSPAPSGAEQGPFRALSGLRYKKTEGTHTFPIIGFLVSWLLVDLQISLKQHTQQHISSTLHSSYIWPKPD